VTSDFKQPSEKSSCGLKTSHGSISDVSAFLHTHFPSGTELFYKLKSSVLSPDMKIKSKILR